jgi:hypothetical protein
VTSPQYDIFIRLPDGHPVWVKAVDSLEEAKQQLAQMAESTVNPPEYFIYNSKNGKLTAGDAGVTIPTR